LYGVCSQLEELDPREFTTFIDTVVEDPKELLSVVNLPEEFAVLLSIHLNELPPSDPVKPVGPGTVDVAPVAPTGPAGPCDPAGPVAPVEPVAPVAP